MSRVDIYQLLHREVVRLLFSWGRRELAREVEREGSSHYIYDYLEKAFAMYYSEYGGVNCRWLREEIKRDWNRVTSLVLPKLLWQVLQTEPAKSRVVQT
ncbi:MAG: hypothetical protein QW680_05910 [Pyrobaculum sp.]